MQLSVRAAALRAAAPARRAAEARGLKLAPIVAAARRGEDQPGRELAPPRRAAGGLAPLAAPGRVSSLWREMESELDAMMSAFGVPSFAAATPWAGGGGLSAAAAGPRAFAVDVHEEKDKYVIRADTPGMSKEDVKVRVSPDGVLTISGERKEAREEEDKERGWVRSERAYGSFSRAFRLPDDVDAEKISASAKDGELVLELPKSAHREPAQPLEIPVKA